MSHTGSNPIARINPTRLSYAEADQGTLLGLYHGYDQARLALARLVCEYGTEAPSDAATQRQIWSRVRREGHAPDLFHPVSQIAGTAEGINRGAHSATLAAFATMSEKAEEILRALRERWPDLRDDAGGPLPSPVPDGD